MEAKNTDRTNPLEASTSPKRAVAPEVLSKKQCEHAKCPHHRCERNDLRIGGIDV
jgi:hypothetical protein